MFPLTPSRADQGPQRSKPHGKTPVAIARSVRAADHNGAIRGDEHLKPRQMNEADCNERLVKAKDHLQWPGNLRSLGCRESVVDEDQRAAWCDRRFRGVLCKRWMRMQWKPA